MSRKSLLFSFSLIFLFTVSSCDKSKLRMEVVKDCTGVYLRNKSGQDFKVCNEDKLEGFANGRKIKVRLDNLNECFGLIEPSQCNETHLFEGRVEVLEIF